MKRKERELQMTGSDQNLDIGIRVAPARFTACVHHVGPYVGNLTLFEGLFARLQGWAAPLGLITPSTERIAAFHNDAKATPPEKQRMSVCLTVPAETHPEEGIDILEFPAGTYAVASGIASFDQHAAAWWELMAWWLPHSGWHHDGTLTFEVLLGDTSDLSKPHRLELWVPVQQ